MHPDWFMQTIYNRKDVFDLYQLFSSQKRSFLPKHNRQYRPLHQEVSHSFLSLTEYTFSKKQVSSALRVHLTRMGYLFYFIIRNYPFASQLRGKVHAKPTASADRTSASWHRTLWYKIFAREGLLNNCYASYLFCLFILEIIYSITFHCYTYEPKSHPLPSPPDHSLSHQQAQ